MRQKPKPKTLFPLRSRRGQNVHIPITFGITKSSAPLTPLLAGKPTVNANSPL